MTASGKAPKVFDSMFDESVILKGNDIDLTFDDKGTETKLYAIRTGDDKWIIDELNDDANLFPEYEEGDEISYDVIKKKIISNSYIVSFNPIGKLKYGIKDWYSNKVKAKAKEIKKGIDKGVRFFSDKLTPELAQDWLRKNTEFKGIKVGRVARANNDIISRYGDPTGKNWLCLSGNPETKEFILFLLYVNGNDIRFMDRWDNLAKDDILEMFKSYSTNSDEEETLEQYDEKADHSEDRYYSSNDRAEDADIVLDESQYQVVDSSKRRKKSRYNGCNVTGCEDGVLVGQSLFSRCIFSDLIRFVNYVNKSGIDFEKSVIDTIKAFVSSLAKIDKDTRFDITGFSGDNLIIDFSKTDKISENYTAIIQFYSDRIFANARGYDLGTNDVIKMTLQSLDKLAK